MINVYFLLRIRGSARFKGKAWQFHNSFHKSSNNFSNPADVILWVKYGLSNAWS